MWIGVRLQNIYYCCYYYELIVWCFHRNSANIPRALGDSKVPLWKPGVSFYCICMFFCFLPFMQRFLQKSLQTILFFIFPPSTSRSVYHTIASQYKLFLVPSSRGELSQQSAFNGSVQTLLCKLWGCVRGRVRSEGRASENPSVCRYVRFLKWSFGRRHSFATFSPVGGGVGRLWKDFWSS